MAEASSLQPSTTVVESKGAKPKSPTVKLKLRKPSTDKKVKWEEGTVDNEHMNKKKSKCCCIYEKPKLFGESSSEDSDSDNDDCTNNCRGHKKKCFKKMPECEEHGESSHDHEPDMSGASGGGGT